MTKVSVHGVCEHGFEELQNLFSWHLESGKDENAQLCVYVDGACVVDLWGSSTTGNFTYGPDLLHVSNPYQLNVSQCHKSRNTTLN